MTINLATLYIIIGSVSFSACVGTFLVLIKKFIEQPPPHCFFSYSDIIASSLLSLALLLDGVIGLVPDMTDKSCYHLKLLYGLFVVAIVTGFFSVLGMSIERFHMFAVVRDYSAIKRKFSIIWFLSSWTLSIVFVIILLPQIHDNLNENKNFHQVITKILNNDEPNYVPASDVFPGPHSEEFNITPYDHAEVTCQEVNHDIKQRQNDRILLKIKNITTEDMGLNVSKKGCPPRSFAEHSQSALDKNQSNSNTNGCVVDEKFIKYYFLLLFLICFLTPVLITISLNFFISLAVRNTQHETISHHQWLTLSACVVMWGPCLIQLLLEKSIAKISFPEPVPVFLFLLGHMHNLLR